MTTRSRAWVSVAIGLAAAGAVTLLMVVTGGTDEPSTSRSSAPDSPTAEADTPPSDSATTAPLAYSPDLLVDGVTLSPSVTVTSDDAADAIAAGRLVDVSTPVITDSSLLVEAVTDMGGLVASRAPGQGLAIEQVVVGTLTAAGDLLALPTVTPDGVDPTVPRQSEAFATRGSTLAWVETPSTDLQFDNWSIFAADLTTRTVVALGSSEDVLPDDLLPIVGPYVTVSIGDSRAYWATPYPRGKRGDDGHYSDFGIEVLSRALDGSGALEVEAEGAILPAADGDCVVFVRVNGSDPTIAENTYRIVQRCEGSPEAVIATGSLGPDGAIGTLAAGDGVVAWSTTNSANDTVISSDIHVLDTTTNTLTAVSIPGQPGIMPESVWGLWVDDGLVQWTTDSTRTVLDLHDTSVWALPATRGYYTVMQSGSWLGWRTTDTSGAATTSVGRWQH